MSFSVDGATCKIVVNWSVTGPFTESFFYDLPMHVFDPDNALRSVIQFYLTDFKLIYNCKLSFIP